MCLENKASRAPDYFIEQKTAAVYGEVSEWLTKCESILVARRAVSQRQEIWLCHSSQQRARRAPDYFIEQKTAAVYGEVSEWLKEHAWKVCKRL